MEGINKWQLKDHWSIANLLISSSICVPVSAIVLIAAQRTSISVEALRLTEVREKND